MRAKSVLVGISAAHREGFVCVDKQIEQTSHETHQPHHALNSTARTTVSVLPSPFGFFSELFLIVFAVEIPYTKLILWKHHLLESFLTGPLLAFLMHFLVCEDDLRFLNHIYIQISTYQQMRTPECCPLCWAARLFRQAVRKSLLPEDLSLAKNTWCL